MSPPPPITRDDVVHLARLARLALTDDEIDGFTGQLGAILDHVGRIQAVDAPPSDATDGTEPATPAAVNVTRPDVETASLTQAEAVAAAPSVADGRFAVPQILGEPQ